MTKTEKVWELMRLLNVETQFQEQMTAAADDLAGRLAQFEKEQAQIREEFLEIVGTSRQFWLDAHHTELLDYFNEPELDGILRMCASPEFRRLTEFDLLANKRIEHLFGGILRHARGAVMSRHEKPVQRPVGFKAS